MSSHKRVQLRITGLVQGVFFRAHTQDQARRLGLQGWVRNRADGSVEALAEGPEDALRQLVGWCRRGSPSSVVEEVQEEWSEAQGGLTGFSVRY